MKFPVIKIIVIVIFFFFHFPFSQKSIFAAFIINIVWKKLPGNLIWGGGSLSGLSKIFIFFNYFRRKVGKTLNYETSDKGIGIFQVGMNILRFFVFGGGKGGSGGWVFV